MREFVLLLLVLLLSLSGLAQVHDTLIYNSKRKLTWQDFKGKPNLTDRSKGAQITVTINLKVKKVGFWTGKAKYDVFAVAFTNASWVKADYKDDYTLMHEQLHFDIAHIYAETLEIELNNLNKPVGPKEQVGDIVKSYVKSMNEYQALYDRETRGGNNVARQKEWANKIKKDLDIIN